MQPSETIPVPKPCLPIKIMLFRKVVSHYRKIITHPVKETQFSGRFINKTGKEKKTERLRAIALAKFRSLKPLLLIGRHAIN